MFYIKEDERYFAGWCISDQTVEVWKGHPSRAMSFDTHKEAEDYISNTYLSFCEVVFVEE